MRLLAAALFAAGLAASTSAAPAPKDEKADKLVGTWKLTKGSPDFPKDGSATVEFTKDGKMTITLKLGDETVKKEGTYKLDGDKIDYKVKTKDGDESAEVLTIDKLTDDELATTDPNGVKEEFKKEKAEKKDDKKEPEKKDPEKKDPEKKPPTR